MNSPLALFIILALAGSSLAVAGIYLLLGLGWSLLASAAFAFAGAAFLRKGMAA
ncbi:hypothetical protein [Shewanella glacialipiscicola]|uniref:hypothetical protein n=1 Tax=Shewanella glacialipiscicola TaxID=614069 RepID=UPI003D7A2137